MTAKYLLGFTRHDNSCPGSDPKENCVCGLRRLRGIARKEAREKKRLQGAAGDMLHALIAVGRWRCIGQDPVTAFEAIGAMFQKDTGFLRPGKSEPAECYYDGREEERQAAWKDWVKKKNKEIDEQIIAAIKKAAEG